MPKCKKCGARLSKFDNDICPVCGEKKPLEGVSSETIEITNNIDTNEISINFKTKKKSLIYSICLGIFGGMFFYLNLIKNAIIWLFINIGVLIGGIGSLLAFLTPLGLIWGYLLMLLICYLLNAILGIFVFKKNNIKDGNGELLR